MKENLKFQWENQAKQLMEDDVFAKKFAEVILEDVIQETVEVKEIYVHLSKREKEENQAVVLDVSLGGKQQKRNMEIYLYQDNEIQMHHKSFQFQYYCVEAPAILMDIGSTRLNLTVREDIMAWWNTAVIKEQADE